MQPQSGNPPAAGLCEKCANVRVVTAQTGSRFYLCQLAAANPQFTKYPRVPVLRCAGFTPQTS